MPVTEIELFYFVKKNISQLKREDLALKFTETYSDYESEDLKSLSKRILRVYERVKNTKKHV